MSTPQVNWSHKALAPDTVLVRELAGESVLLDLATEAYFGLDSVGATMWRTLTTADSINDAFVSLCGVFDADEAVLRADLEKFLSRLVELGLLDVEAE